MSSDLETLLVAEEQQYVSGFLSRSLQSRWFSLQIHHRDISGGPVATVLLFLRWMGDQLHSQGREKAVLTLSVCVCVLAVSPNEIVQDSMLEYKCSVLVRDENRRKSIDGVLMLLMSHQLETDRQSLHTKQ